MVREHRDPLVQDISIPGSLKSEKERREGRGCQGAEAQGGQNNVAGRRRPAGLIGHIVDPATRVVHHVHQNAAQVRARHDLRHRVARRVHDLQQAGVEIDIGLGFIHSLLARGNQHIQRQDIPLLHRLVGRGDQDRDGWRALGGGSGCRRRS